MAIGGGGAAIEQAAESLPRAEYARGLLDRAYRELESLRLPGNLDLEALTDIARARTKLARAEQILRSRRSPGANGSER